MIAITENKEKLFKGLYYPDRKYIDGRYPLRLLMKSITYPLFIGNLKESSILPLRKSLASCVFPLRHVKENPFFFHP